MFYRVEFNLNFDLVTSPAREGMFWLNILEDKMISGS